MADTELQAALLAFTEANGFQGKGPLSVALVVTTHARTSGLPLNPDQLLTPKGGQVRGLGGSAAQLVLEKHGILRRLSSEGGRTSRGSIRKMREYVTFLNELRQPVDLDAVEAYWTEQVRAFFRAQPFKVRLDVSRSLRSVVRDVLAQAEERQKQSDGTHYAGAMLQHLVGAKLDCALGEGQLTHHAASTADEPGGRAGAFVVGDVAVHATTKPAAPVIARCHGNLNDGLRPILVTLERGLLVAQELARQEGLDERIDIFGVEQFVALNIYELGNFKGDGRKLALDALVKRYNAIVKDVETDPSLQIDIG